MIDRRRADVRSRCRLLLAGGVIATLMGLTAADPAGGQTATAGVEASGGLDGQPLTLAIKVAEPMVLESATVGDPAGYTIAVLEEVARRNGWAVDYLVVDTVTDQLAAVERGAADAAAAAISITAEREQDFDFSVPILDAGLQVMVRDESGFGSIRSIGRLLTAPVLTFLAAILVASAVFGLLVWLVERRAGTDFGGEGFLDGIWWSIVTLVTVGYGDHVPRTKFGRLLAVMWMLTSVVLLANFTAFVTTKLTVDELSAQIAGIEDVRSGSLAVIADTTSQEYADSLGLRSLTADDLERAVELLRNDTVDAVVYDAPVLRHYALTAGRGEVIAVGPVFRSEYYGVAMRPDSPLVEPIDSAILEMQADGTMADLQATWFGS